MAELPLAADGTVVIEGRELTLTTLDRPLFPAAGWTKRDLVAYYLAVAPVLVPHLRGRPLTLARFPDGVDGRGFLQNECRGRPAWMRSADLRLRTGAVRRYCVLDEAAALAWVANLAAVELHPYLVDVADPDRPVALVLDLDPGEGASLVDCCRVALRLRLLLAEHGLDAPVKTSGGAGLHLAIPVRGASFAATKAFARTLAARLRADAPDAVTDDLRPGQRHGRVLVDWLQNEPRRSTVAPYSLRAAATPLVSTPLLWEEVEAAAAEGDARPLLVRPADVLERIGRHGDLYASALGPPARLPEPGA